MAREPERKVPEHKAESRLQARVPLFRELHRDKEYKAHRGSHPEPASEHREHRASLQARELEHRARRASLHKPGFLCSHRGKPL